MSSSTSVSGAYNKMVGSVYTPSGTPVSQRLPSLLAADAGHCELICISATPTCNMFGYSSSTRQCTLFDLNATDSFAAADDNLYTYYRYTVGKQLHASLKSCHVSRQPRHGGDCRFVTSSLCVSAVQLLLFDCSWKP